MAGLKDEAVGAAELLATLLSGAVAPVPSVLSGIHGDLSGQGQGRKIASDTMSKYTYQPRTETGRRNLEAVGKAFEASKLPPVGPMSGLPMPRVRGADLSVIAGRSMEPGPGRMAAQIGAVKAPGGHWSPESQSLLASIIANGAENGPVRQWADRMVPKYMARQMGTENDPLNKIPMGRDMSYENVTDKLIGKTPYNQNAGDLEGVNVPMGARVGEDVYHLRQNRMMQHPEFEAMMGHVGDVASQIPQNDLMRMDMNQLVQYAQRQKQQMAKVKDMGYDPSMVDAAKFLTRALRPEIEGKEGAWYRFTKGMDPRELNKQVSLDTSILNHCVGGVCGPDSQHSGIWKNRWIPGLDPRDNQPVDLAMLAPGARGQQREHSGYVDKVLRGGADILSYRTKDESIPIATMETMRTPNQGVNRADARSAIGWGDYNRWRAEREAAGVPIENLPRDIPGGGRLSPARGTLSNDALQNLQERFPQHAEVIQQLMKAEPPQRVSQLRGWGNRAVAPRYSQDMADTLSKMGLDPMYGAGMKESGVFIQGTQRPTGTLENLQSWKQRSEVIRPHLTPNEQERMSRLLAEAKPAIEGKPKMVTNKDAARALEELGQLLAVTRDRPAQ